MLTLIGDSHTDSRALEIGFSGDLKDSSFPLKVNKYFSTAMILIACALHYSEITDRFKFL